MILKLRATIPSSKVFVREYEVPANMSLFDFNKFINNDLGFSSDQIVVYRAIDEKGVMAAAYGLFDIGFGSMDKITFEQIAAQGFTVLHFCYDMHNNSYMVLTILGEEAGDIRVHYPRLTLEKGHNPDQFSPKYVDPEVYIPRAVAPVASDDIDDDDDLDDDDDDDDEIFDEDEDGIDSDKD